eukprot:jgi/Ulvmu1/8066/UM004_0303.1
MSVFVTTVLALTVVFFVIDGIQTSVAMVQDDDKSVKHHWALLVAGSSGWGNYRHQADVAHAYQALKEGGFEADRIVVMMADDIAHSQMNPYPGKVFNCPGCDDVYAGLHVDYRGENVTAENLLAVLRGDPMHGIGTGRTIASGSRDRVFFFYADHGATGIAGMPTGAPLFADKLADALEDKHSAGGYLELLVFFEACESGSMFQGLLAHDLPVFATTAANASESSWATYCPDYFSTEESNGTRTPDELGTCLGDLYSVSWVELAEHVDLKQWSLQAEFEAVRIRTSNNHTYHYGSHAQEYGTMRISHERSSDFEGSHAARAGMLRSAAAVSLPQHEADLAHLRAAAAGSGAAAAAAAQELQEAHRVRARIDGSVRAAVGTVLLQHMPAVAQQTTSLTAIRGEAGPQSEALDEAAMLWMAAHDARQADQAVVDSWECLREYVAHYERHCGRLTSYAARHSKSMAKLCNAGVPPESWGAALALSCQ